MATLYVVGTPIGNLDDISLRALRVLAEVDYILCEDTRVSKKLLSHFGIDKPTMSYHAHTGNSKTKKILELLHHGKNLALVSDAGTPSISDPGSMLVSEIYRSRQSVQVVTIPGPSAVTSALSISGIPASDFLFLGFLPHKKGRETLFKEIASSIRPVVFYESPHRILKCLRSLQSVLGSERLVVVGRELTKIHEEVVRDTPSGILGYFTNHPDKVRGEFVVVVGV